MADNAAQSIKDLQERLVSADKTLGEMLQRLGQYDKYLSILFTDIAQKAKVSIDEISNHLVKKMRRENLKQSESLIKDILGLDEGKKEVEKIPTMFERVINEINAKAANKRGFWANELFHSEFAVEQAKKNFARVYREFAEAKNAPIAMAQASFAPELERLSSIDQSILSKTDLKKIQERIAQVKSDLASISKLQVGGEAYKDPSLLEALKRYQDALEKLRQVKEQIEALNGKEGNRYAANASMVEGVTRKFNENEQALAKLKQRWEELNVKKQAGLISQKDFDAQTQKILDEYDRLIAKRKEFEIGDLGQMSYQRKSEREQEEERLAQLRKSNTQARLDDEMRAEKMIKAERAKREAKENAAIREQVTNYKQLSALLKQYNSLKQVKGRTQEEEAALERTRQKIKEIIAEMRKLDKEQKGSLGKARDITEYDRILAKDREITNEKKKQNDLTKQQKANLNSLLPTLQRLASAFGVAFSVRGLAQFGKKLIETRGEFEMQFVAMKQIIGDVDAATKIWNQTMQQALQSPFKAMQLVTYTKQLAAYRIETEKLFDTTKRLADISAGLGVDMGRLILAYGQVKAANFLRASEIRQFTEAGVNVLGELSKYFTEIEGRAVSTAQVMERVTKRMVTFADVEEIFKRMTDEGGQFFEMQEVQSDTVKGQIAKLHDAYDQMLNSIGKANQGTLRNFIGALNRIVRNWDKFASVLKKVIGIFVTFKVAQATAAIQMIKASKAADAQSLGISGLTARLVNLIAVEKSTTESTLTLSAALKQLNSSKGGWIGVAVSAALTAAIAIADYYKRAHQLSKDLSQITTDTQIRARKSTTDYEQMAEKIRDVNTSEKERKDTLSKLKRMYEDILPARMLEIEYITKEGNAYNDAKESIRAYYEEKRKQEALDKVYETYSKDVTDNQEHFASVIADIIEKQTGLAVSTREINIVIDELVERFKKGEVNAQNYFEVLNQLLNTQIGVTIDREKLSKTGEGVIETFGDAVKIDEWAKGFLESVSTLDEKLEEAGANATEFGKSIKDALDTKVFDEVEKSIEKDAKALSEATFNEELDFEVSNYEKRAREAFEAFKTTFKEEYDKNPQFFEDQFEIKLKFNLEEKGIQYAKDDIEKQGKAIEHSVIDNQKTINSEIEKLAEQTSISDKEILRQFQVDTSVEFDKWIQNQLSQIDLYKTDLLRIQKGLTSDMTDEHIAMLQTLEPFLPLWEKYLKGLTPAKKTKNTRTTHENASKLISLIKEMRSEYDKLSKSAYGYAKSEEKVRDAYKQSYEEILKQTGVAANFDFTTNQGEIEALKKVRDYIKGNAKYAKDAWKDVQKTIDQLTAETEIEISVRIREDFGKQMEDMLNNYQLTVELQGLEIDENLAKEWLNTTYTSLGDILDAANDFANGLIEKGNFDKEDLEKYKQYVDKVENEILKTRKEKTKEYSKYLEKEMSERAKKEMEFAIKSAEVQGAQIFTEDQKNAILSNMEDEYTKAMQELTWKSFKESTFYVEMMDDLTSIPATYSSLMLAKINELLMSPQVLSPRAFKEAINARQKILEAQMQLKPLRTMIANRDLVNAVFADESLGLKKRGTMGGKRRELDKEILARTENIDKLEKEAEQYAHLTAQVEAYEKAETKANNAMKNVGLTLEGATGESVQQEIDNRKDRLDLLKQEEERYKELKEIQGAGGLTDAQQTELKELANNVNIRAKEIEGLEAEIKMLGEAKQAVLSYCSALDVLNRPENEDALTLVSGGEVTTVGGNVVRKGNLSQQQQENKNQLKNQKNALQSLKEARKGTIKWVKAWHEFQNQLNDTIGKVKDMGNAFYDTYEALGGETDALTEGWKEFGSTMIDAITSALTMIPTLVTGFTAAGVAINSAMGIIGLIAEAIQLVLVLITGLAKLHDAGVDKQIEDSKKKVDALQKAYDRLEKSIEKTFDTVSYMMEYNQEVQNLYEQIEEANNQIAAAQDYKNKKKKEETIEAAEETKQQALDALDEIKQAKNDVFGGIGKEGYRDAAQGFVDAWKSAFLETGDGLQGLQDHFDEFLNDWFVKQATMRVAANKLNPLFEQIDRAVDQYSVGGADVWLQELQDVREQFGVIAPQLSEALEELAGMWGLGGEGALSGLAAGIQGMTEEQANILEAYWNSVRGYTANIDMNVATIVGLLSNDTRGGGGGVKGNIFGDPNVETNPMLKQLDLIAVNTAATHRILQSVTKSGHSQGGYGIKVFAD